MRRPPRFPLRARVAACAAAVGVLALLPRAADAEPRKCEQAISFAAAKFARLEYKALRKCNDAVVKGVRPGPCPDALATSRLAKAAADLHTTIAFACGGSDDRCDGVDDDPLSSIGWDVGSCPNFENGSCTNAIANCGDVADCISCVGGAAVAQAIALTYGDRNPSASPAVVGCQRALGKSTEKFFATKAKALQKCEQRVLLGFASGPCPDAVAGAAIAKAEAKKVRTICKSCGGPDHLCGTGDDLDPTTVGFAASCPAVTVPDGASCAAPITDLQSIVACVDCVADFKAACVDALAVPELVPYPPECNPGPAATPTPTSTPAATLPLPTVTLPVATVTLPLPTLTPPVPTLTLPLPTATPPLPTVTLPLPTATLPLPTVTLPLPTATLPLPTVTLPLPLPTVTIPLATATTTPVPTASATPVPTLTATASAAPTATPTVTASSTQTPTPTPTATPVCGNGTLEPGEVCELPAIGCPALQVCVLCQQCL